MEGLQWRLLSREMRDVGECETSRAAIAGIADSAAADSAGIAAAAWKAGVSLSVEE